MILTLYLIIPTFNSSKLKEFANDNFKFHENGKNFSIRVENTVEKGEIAHNDRFLLFPQCFQKSCERSLLKTWQEMKKMLVASIFPECFLFFQKQISYYSLIFFMSSASSFNLDQSKNLSFGKELIFTDPRNGYT